MSACICIMNQHAVALAADSAVTIGGGIAIHNSVNKLFSLSRVEPLGALIYANANFMNVPVELILKQYRKYIDEQKEYYNTLEEYVDSFLRFLKNKKDLFRFSLNEERFIMSTVSNLLNGLDTDVKNYYKDQVESLGRDLNEEERSKCYKAMVKATCNFVNSFKDLVIFSEKDYIKQYFEESIYKYIKERYGNKLSEEDLHDLTEASITIVSKDFWRNGYVGIAIAGYGKNEIYPSMIHLHLAGYLNGNLKYRIVEKKKIDENNTYCITPLAQVDVMETFLYGLNNNFLRYIQNTIPKTLGDDIDKLPDEFFSEGGKERVKKELEMCTAHIVNSIVNEAHQKYFNPIRKSINGLPIEELAILAESMINLTSLRRQMAIDAASRTVGGPIDVAVISKSDGLIWIKRKHYFDGKLNPQYFSNNFGGFNIE